MDYISTKEAAKQWGISANRITILCGKGRISGAIQIGTRWFIPKGTKKPQDNRFRKTKNNGSNYVPFRFFPFDSRTKDEFIPPLSSEELQVKKVYEYFELCEFSKAGEELLKIDLGSLNKYNLIYTLFASCMIDVMKGNTDAFIEDYERLNIELEEDFPRRKELSTLSHEVDGILGATTFYVNDFSIDPSYSYDDSYVSHLSYLSLVSLLFSKNNFSELDVLPYEIACSTLDKTSYLVDAQTIHFYLGIIYHLMNKKEKMEIHIKKGFDLAKTHKLYWLPSLIMFYYKEIAEPVLATYPKDFYEHIIGICNDIKNRFSSFMDQASKHNMYRILLSNNYSYVFYALQGYSNKEIANILGTTESAVNNRYSRIYQDLNVFNKKELVEYYLQSTTNSIFKNK